MMTVSRPLKRLIDAEGAAVTRLFWISMAAGGKGVLRLDCVYQTVAAPQIPLRSAVDPRFDSRLPDPLPRLGSSRHMACWSQLGVRECCLGWYGSWGC